jgi:SpoVK/Ycf46/Vps4 family AAA+-type ATPase
MPKEVMMALCGCRLTATEFLKIDKTKMADVLTEEEGFKDIMETKPTEEKTSNENVEDEEGSESGENVENMNDDELEKELESLSLEKHDFDLYAYLRKDSTQPAPKVVSLQDEHAEFLTAYQTDVEYLDDRFQWIATRIKIRNMEMEKDDEAESNYRNRERSYDAILRELCAKERMLIRKCEKRLAITFQENSFVPRLERLSRLRNLDSFEQLILICLIGAIISHDVNIALSSSFKRARDFTVGHILWVLCENLQLRITNRSYFYKKANLVRDGMISMGDKLHGDLYECNVDIDRRMLDYIVGLDCEFGELVEGSHLYLPATKLENVVMNPEIKMLIVETVGNFEKFKSAQRKLGFENVLGYNGGGIVLLFFGESGTGKTMLANGLACHLQKRILLVNFGNLGTNASELLKYIFREAKINDALLFFDECETFFESRRKGNSSDVSYFLTEIEKHDGLIVMATNRAYDLDEAMHRRITLAIEFLPPDLFMRKQIWAKHLPESIPCDNIDLEPLATNFELTGGLIKNAVMQALSFAVARNGDAPVICQADLERAARLQLRGIFQSSDFDRRIMPSKSLQDLILEPILMEQMLEIIRFEKVRKVLYGQWGFGDSDNSRRKGTSVLLTGSPGTGKSLCAEVLGYELGCALKIVDLNSILAQYAFNTSKNIESLFRETKKTGAVIVFEVAMGGNQGFGPKLDSSVANLLYNIEHYDGMIIMITDSAALDDTLMSRFKFVMKLTSPDQKLRAKLWRKCIPAKVPLAEDVDFDSLAREFKEFNGGNIYNSVFRAASKAASDSHGIVTMNLLKQAADQELKITEANRWKSDHVKAIYN